MHEQVIFAQKEKCLKRRTRDTTSPATPIQMYCEDGLLHFQDFLMHPSRDVSPQTHRGSQLEEEAGQLYDDNILAMDKEVLVMDEEDAPTIDEEDILTMDEGAVTMDEDAMTVDEDVVTME